MNRESLVLTSSTAGRVEGLRMITLYHSLYSTCSQKVRLSLAEKEIDYQSVIIDFNTLEHLSDDYLALNPNGVVPTLIHDGNAITDSSVICEYLDEVFPTTRLSPVDALGRAKMRAWMRFLEEMPTSAIRVPSFNKLFAQRLSEVPAAVFDNMVQKTPLRKELYRALRNGKSFQFDEQKLNDAIEKLNYTLDRANDALSTQTWLLGDALSIADCVLLPTVVRMADLGLTEHFENVPHLTAWFKNFVERPSFAKAYPKGARVSDEAWSFDTIGAPN